MNSNPDMHNTTPVKEEHRSGADPSAGGGAPGKQIFYGWWVLLAGACINFVGAGISYHSFSVFFLPLQREFGVSRAAVSLLYGAARLEGGIEGPLIGYLIDRFGSRRLIIMGAICAAVGFLFLSTVNSFLTFFLTYVFVVAFGSNAAFFHPVSTAINKWFIRHRGLGFSVLTASGSIGGSVMAPFLSFIILQYGWRIGAIVAGLSMLAVAVPAGMRIKNAPEEMGLHPDGREPSVPTSEGPATAAGITLPYNFTVRESLRTTQFWLLMLCISLRIMVTVAVNTHFVPIFVWRGMSEATSAYLLSLYAFMTVPLAIVLGWTGDRWNKSRLCSLTNVPMILAMVGMICYRGEAIFYFFAVAFAIIMATAPTNWAIIGDFFGRNCYATLRGIMGIGYGAATFLSPIYAGWIFDRTESYYLVLITFSVILAVTTLLFLVLSPPSHPQPRTRTEPT